MIKNPVAGALAVIGTLAVTACNSLGGTAAPSTSPIPATTAPSVAQTSAAPTPSASPTPTGPALGSIIVPVPNEIRSDADAQQLEPADLGEFAQQQLTRFSADCPAETVAITIEKMRVDDMATGTLHDCGSGAAFLWARIDGQWKEVFAGQSAPPVTNSARPASEKSPRASSSPSASIPAGMRWAISLERLNQPSEPTDLARCGERGDNE